MQTKSFVNHILAPFLLFMLLIVPVFAIELLLDWSSGALGMSVIGIGVLFPFIDRRPKSLFSRPADTRRLRRAGGRNA